MSTNKLSSTTKDEQSKNNVDDTLVSDASDVSDVEDSIDDSKNKNDLKENDEENLNNEGEDSESQSEDSENVDSEEDEEPQCFIDDDADQPIEKVNIGDIRVSRTISRPNIIAIIDLLLDQNKTFPGILKFEPDALRYVNHRMKNDKTGFTKLLDNSRLTYSSYISLKRKHREIDCLDDATPLIENSKQTTIMVINVLYVIKYNHKQLYNHMSANEKKNGVVLAKATKKPIQSSECIKKQRFETKSLSQKGSKSPKPKQDTKQESAIGIRKKSSQKIIDAKRHQHANSDDNVNDSDDNVQTTQNNNTKMKEENFTKIINTIANLTESLVKLIDSNQNKN
jgi:hypothetical protein